MKIGILGTGMVGKAIGSQFIQLGHKVMMDYRTAGNDKAIQWANPSQETFADAAKY